MVMQFGETRMLLLAALQLADETADLQAEIAALKAGGAVAAPPPPPAEPDPELLERLNGVAEAIETIAATLERA
jgi:cell division protein ZapA